LFVRLLPARSSTASASAGPTATSTAAATSLALFGFVDADLTTVELGAVHFLHRFFTVSVVVVGHETEPTASTGFTVGNDFGFSNGSKSLERAQ
jgi:hypothetical protein